MIGKGSVVTWTSQAGGRAKKKIGTVVEEVPAGAFVGDVTDVGPGNVWGASPMMGCGLPRKGNSFIVLVREGKGKPKFYWPRRWLLREVAP